MEFLFEGIDDVLARRVRPLTVFFRDDDGGWRDERLDALGRVFVEYGVPLDVAAIPAACTAATARIVDGLRGTSGLINIHQHGYRHLSHEPTGRKSEFGASRSFALQHSDILQGALRLKELFGVLTPRMFTPPWNRCTQDTITALVELGFLGLSRDVTAASLRLHGLAGVDVGFDWHKRKGGRRLEPDAWNDYLCTALADADTLGVMLHHAEMDGAEIAALRRLLEILLASDRVEISSLGALVEVGARAATGTATWGERECH